MVRLSRFGDGCGDDWRGYRGAGRIRIVDVAPNMRRNQFVRLVCRFLSILGRDLRTLDENQGQITRRGHPHRRNRNLS